MTDTLVQITDNVWIFPRDEDPARAQPNVGIVVAGHKTVLIDGGNSPRHARRIMIALDDIEAPAVSHIIYTHSHWDHVFGAMVFGATALGHELCRKQLGEMVAKPWSHSYIQEEIQRSPAREAGLRAMSRAMEDWRNFRIVQPEVVFSRHLTLHMDSMTFELDHVGGLHSPDSIAVRIPEARVMFIGDSYYPPASYLRHAEDTYNFALMRSLLSEDIDHYIDGHNPPMTRDTFSRFASGTLPDEIELH